MVNPGAFSGSRKAFLHDQQDIYAAAVGNGHISDTVADIQRRYFKRYPIDLPHKQEPSSEWLAQVDDGTPDAEMKHPDAEKMSHEEWQVEAGKYDAQIRDIKARKDVSNHFIVQLSCNLILSTPANQETPTVSIHIFSRRIQGVCLRRSGPTRSTQRQTSR